MFAGRGGALAGPLASCVLFVKPTIGCVLPKGPHVVRAIRRKFAVYDAVYGKLTRHNRREKH